MSVCGIRCVIGPNECSVSNCTFAVSFICERALTMLTSMLTAQASERFDISDASNATFERCQQKFADGAQLSDGKEQEFVGAHL